MFVNHRHLGGGGGGEAGFNDVHTHALQCAYDQTVDHGAAEACVATHDEGEAFACVVALEECGESRGELHHIDGAETVTSFAADGASDARNGFNKTHIVVFF